MRGRGDGHKSVRVKSVARSVRPFLGGSALLALLSLCLYVTGFVRLSPGLTALDAVDFGVYYEAARALNEGAFQSLYARPAAADLTAAAPTGAPPYNYPPFVAVALRPLATLPQREATLVWLAVNVASLACAALPLVRLAELPARAAWLLFGVALSFPPVLQTLLFGQVNVALLCLLAVAVWLLDGRTRTPLSDALAGGLIGVAAGIKLYPALLVIPLILRGRWRAAAGACTTLGATVLLGIVGAGGLHNTWTYVTDVIPTMGAPRSYSNQSLLAGVRRLFDVHVYEFEAFQPEQRITLVARPLVDAPALIGPVYVALLVMLVVGTGLCAWRLRAAPSSFRLDASIVLALSVAAPPMVWDHWHTVLLLSWCGLLSVQAPRQRRAILPAIGAAMLLIALHRYWRAMAFLGVPVATLSFALLAALTTWGASAWVAIRTSGARRAQS